jgi:hypothetical protein
MEMMVVREDVCEREIAHDDHRRAVDERVLLVEARGVEVEAALEEIAGYGFDTCLTQRVADRSDSSLSACSAGFGKIRQYFTKHAFVRDHCCARNESLKAERRIVMRVKAIPEGDEKPSIRETRPHHFTALRLIP